MKYRSRASFLILLSLFTADSVLAQSSRADRKPVAFVRRLTLIDAATKGPISELRDGMSIRLADIPEDRLDILAETYPRRVDSVTFKLVEQGTARSDLELPFTLRGGKSAKQAWRAKPGMLTLVVQPIQNGSPGIPLRMKVTFIGNRATSEAPELTAKAESAKAPAAAKVESAKIEVAKEVEKTEPPRVVAAAEPVQNAEVINSDAAKAGRARLADPIAEAEEIGTVGRRIEPTTPPSQSDRCRAMLRQDEGRMTVVCSHSLINANSAQLILRGGYATEEEDESQLCQFENATSPIVTSCAYLDNQLERLEVRIRSADGKERQIPVEVD